jgi:hypothetical protein
MIGIGAGIPIILFGVVFLKSGGIGKSLKKEEDISKDDLYKMVLGDSYDYEAP